MSPPSLTVIKKVSRYARLKLFEDMYICTLCCEFAVVYSSSMSFPYNITKHMRVSGTVKLIARTSIKREIYYLINVLTIIFFRTIKNYRQWRNFHSNNKLLIKCIAEIYVTWVRMERDLKISNCKYVLCAIIENDIIYLCIEY